MISGKIKTRDDGRGGQLHRVCVRVTNELGSELPPGAAPLTPIDVFPAHLPDPRRGSVRRLRCARTNRAGTVLVALVHDARP